MLSDLHNRKPGVYLLAVDSYLVIRKDRPAVFCRYVDPGGFAFIPHPIGQEVLQ